jgi:hypothetical protein
MMEDIHRKLNRELTWHKRHSTRIRPFFTSKWGLNLRKKIIKWYIWIIALCSAENWALWRVDQKYLEILRDVVLEKVGEHQLD